MGIMFVCISANLLNAQNRTYLLHSDNNINRLKRLVKSNDSIAYFWNQNYQEAERLAGKENFSVEDNQVLALAYRMTGENKFAEAIKRNLLSQIERNTWEGGILAERTPPWKAGLGTAKYCFNMALGYDAIYLYLSKQERKIISDKIVALGIQPAMDDWLSVDNSIHTLDTMGHNWWSACVFMAGFAAAALRNEVPEAKGWVQNISQQAEEWVNYSGSVLQNKINNFDKDGGFYESINYAAFGISEYLMFRYAAEQALPEIKQPELPVLEKTADFFIYTTYYTSQGRDMTVNFGDTGIYRTGNACVVMLYNLGYQQKRYAWYLKHVNKGKDREGLEIGSPNGLLMAPELPEIGENYVPDLPQSHLFADMNWATFRNSWKDDATMLAVKSGFSWNHSHADVGSFILFHNGKNLLIDSGNSYYSSPLYTSYYCQSEAHNVILFNGEGQDRKDPYFGTVNHGSLYHLIEDKNYKYILADATGPYSQILRRNYRSFLWVGNVILVIDDLLAHKSGKFEWLLHYNGTSKRNGLNLSVKEGDAEVLVHPLFPETFPNAGLPHDFPEKMQLEEKTGYKDHHPEETVNYWSISHFRETDRTKLINAIILKNEGEALPVIERFEGIDYLGIRIIQNGKVTEIYLNLLADGSIKHRNSIITMNGWETDAYLLAISYDTQNHSKELKPADIENVFIGHGSYLRKGGQTMIHSLSKFYAGIKYSELPEIHFDGQNGARVFLGTTSKTLNLNGKQIETEKSEEPKGVYFNNNQ